MMTMLLITACTIAPSKPLQQQLAEAASPSERKETLYAGCLKEAEWPRSSKKVYHGGGNTRHGSHSPYTSEVRQMKLLCNQINEATISNEELTDSCAKQIATKRQIERKGNAEHIARVQFVCEEMTGQKLK